MAFSVLRGETDEICGESSCTSWLPAPVSIYRTQTFNMTFNLTQEVGNPHFRLQIWVEHPYPDKFAMTLQPPCANESTGCKSVKIMSENSGFMSTRLNGTIWDDSAFNSDEDLKVFPGNVAAVMSPSEHLGNITSSFNGVWSLKIYSVSPGSPTYFYGWHIDLEGKLSPSHTLHQNFRRHNSSLWRVRFSREIMHKFFFFLPELFSFNWSTTHSV